ncbi:MAG TPA: lipoate--protein ligase family protein [Candidatus Brocadiia bacterium]|nr:biotin/lipoate A/B protein ligase family protein [Candidatus Brocadiales bacterium]
MLPKEWRLISDLKGNTFMNMAIDEAIAISYVGAGFKPAPTIRFYTWGKPAVSIGYFQRIMPVVNWLNNSPSLNTPLYPLLIEGKGTIDIVRRPTGGGVVLHGTDLTYSVATGLPRGFAPRNDNSSRNLIPLFYRHMGQAMIEGLRLLGINANLKSAVGAGFKPASTQNPGLSLCAQTPVGADVLVEGIKVAGCAARRFGDTLLLQGYISIGHIVDITAQQLIDAMIKGFTVSLDIELLHGKLTDEEASLAGELNNKKYSRREWNYKR